MRVSVNEYPQNLPWEMKSYTMPNMPRGEYGVVYGLKVVLELVRSHTTSAHRLDIAGSDSKIDLGTACVRLRPMRLVVKTQSGWELSEEAEKWLDSQDDFYLAAVLCARIKFLAEILYHLDTPKKAAELQEIARNEYFLQWKTLSDVNARLVWLRQLGLVDFQEFSLLYRLTQKGEEFVKYIEIQEPVLPEVSLDDTIEEENVDLSGWAITQDETLLSERKASIGYLIGDVQQFCATILDFIQLIDGGKTYEQIYEYTKTHYDIAASSLRSFLTTLTNMKFLERKTNTLYDVTENARVWAERHSVLDLVSLMHRQFGFMFEMLAVLDNNSLTYKELAAIAKVSYGFTRENVEEIRKRVIIFKAAKLIRNDSADTFTITNRGKLLLKMIAIEKPCKNVAQMEEHQESEDAKFLTELRLATKDSVNYERLEKLVAIAFQKLGFESQWLGGSGKTDVLIHAAGVSAVSYSVAIDAKSTMSGIVNDGLIDFDTLGEHRKKHNANFSAVVGGSFQNERLIKRAVEHGVVLIDIESLEKLIKEHIKTPLNVASYKKVFQTPGVIDVACLEHEREEVSRYGELLHAVMDCLIAVQDDEVYKGFLQERDIYGFLRTREGLSKPYSLEEIANMLNFLASPLIGCVEKTKEGYFAIGTLMDASQKFEFFSNACKKTKDGVL